MKKFLLLLFVFFIMEGICLAKDTVKFEFPNEGWHNVESPDRAAYKKCYVPVNQTNQNYTEMLILSERILKNPDLSPMVILNKQLGKDRLNYKDIVPEYMSQDTENPMVAWCSRVNNTCAVERAFKGENGIILAIYINKMPHYSQNMFGQWSNILNQIKVYNPESDDNSNLIDL